MEEVRNSILEVQENRKKQINSNFMEDRIVKGRGEPEGTQKVWSGERFVKQNGQWKYQGKEGKGGSEKEYEAKEKKYTDGKVYKHPDLPGEHKYNAKTDEFTHTHEGRTWTGKGSETYRSKLTSPKYTIISAKKEELANLKGELSKFRTQAKELIQKRAQIPPGLLRRIEEAENKIEKLSGGQKTEEKGGVERSSKGKEIDERQSREQGQKEDIEKKKSGRESKGEEKYYTVYGVHRGHLSLVDSKRSERGDSIWSRKPIGEGDITRNHTLNYKTLNSDEKALVDMIIKNKEIYSGSIDSLIRSGNPPGFTNEDKVNEGYYIVEQSAKGAYHDEGTFLVRTEGADYPRYITRLTGVTV